MGSVSWKLNSGSIQFHLTIRMVDPRFNQDGTNAVDNDDSVFVHVCDLGDECILVRDFNKKALLED